MRSRVAWEGTGSIPSTISPSTQTREQAAMAAKPGPKSAPGVASTSATVAPDTRAGLRLLRSAPARTGEEWARSATDHRHGAAGPKEARFVDAVAGALPPHRAAEVGGDLVVAAPDRSRERTETSSSEKRQLRTAPSAVSRSRLQVPQKGWVTLETTPISPGPSREPEPVGRCGVARPTDGYKRPRRFDAWPDLAPGTTPVAAPAARGVERHELDEPDDPAGRPGRSRRNRGSRPRSPQAAARR